VAYLGVVPDSRDALLKAAIERFPEPWRPHLLETSGRLLSIRSPAQAVVVVEDEYEHLLRVAVPFVIRYPMFRRRASAVAFVGAMGALAAAAEEADELLSLASVGTLTAPATSVVVALGFLATAGETYAAASVRVHQLHAHHCDVDTERLASDVRRAMFGDITTEAGVVAIAKRAVDGAAGRFSKRWAVGAVPIFGIGYASFDSARTIRRVLRLPLPDSSFLEQSRNGCDRITPAGTIRL
jgi:hypothetical protein